LLTLWGDTVISVSEDAKKHLIDYFRVTPSHIKVIHNGIKLPDTDWDDIKHNKNSKPNLNGGATIANIARMSPEKDQESLFIAMKMVLHDHPDARLVMIGKGPLENNLKRLAVALDIERNIEFVGEVENISDILLKTDIVVLSSLTEGLPISILEALSFGIPIVATSVGDIPEIISDGKTGCLVQPKNPEALANAINFMLSNYDAAMKMGENGKKLVRDKFSVKQMATETEKVYLSLLSASN
jgi:glycosyltransferase involved in cell wall biosynthesis